MRLQTPNINVIPLLKQRLDLVRKRCSSGCGFFWNRNTANIDIYTTMFPRLGTTAHRRSNQLGRTIAYNYSSLVQLLFKVRTNWSGCFLLLDPNLL